MNKDNLLFAIIGMLFGFTMGYVLHEIMVARQPLRRLAGEGAVTSSSAAPEDAGAASAEPGSPAGTDAGAATAGGGTAGVAADGAAGGPGGSAAPGGSPPPAMAAVQELRDYVATHPKDADAVLKLANLNFDISNWPRARELYTQYLGLRDPNPDVLTDLGNCNRQLRQFDRALEQFRRAQQLAPGHWKSLFAEVVVLAFDLNQRDAADQAFARLQAAAPNQPEVAQLGAELQRRRGAAAGGTGARGATGRQGGSGGGR